MKLVINVLVFSSVSMILINNVNLRLLSYVVLVNAIQREHQHKDGLLRSTGKQCHWLPHYVIVFCSRAEERRAARPAKQKKKYMIVLFYCSCNDVCGGELCLLFAVTS